jgi:hypothetical protein
MIAINVCQNCQEIGLSPLWCVHDSLCETHFVVHILEPMVKRTYSSAHFFFLVFVQICL